ncbi:MAG: BamA/OMP85 family outer membrane protein [Candidatus Sumerlaeaceae bacterium]
MVKNLSSAKLRKVLFEQHLWTRVFLCLIACNLCAGRIAAQAAFPTADNQVQHHVLPTDEESAAPMEDPDGVVMRERTPADDQKIARDQAAKARKSAATKPVTSTDPLLSEISDAPVVKEIEVAGLDGPDLRRAMRALVTREGEPLNPDKQREDIKNLYEVGSFRPDIQVEAEELDGGVKLRYLVEPNPKVGAINVTGNVKVPTKKLLAELPVKAGETYTVQAQNKIRETLARYYEERGYGDAAVHVEERPGPANTVDLGISLDEGTKTKIRNLVIRGNEHVGDLGLKLRASNKGSWGPFKHYYNEAKFEDDLNVVRAVMANHGYLDADVRRGEFAYAEDRSWVDPVIEVSEGPCYKFGRLEARGYSVYSRDEVLEGFRPLQGQVYSPAEFEKRAERVKNMYGDEGFLNCSIEPNLHKDPNTGTVDVDLDITEGSRIYVGDVKVVADTYAEDKEQSWLRRAYSKVSPPVKDEVVRREVRMRPGQVYRRFDEVRTKERLRALNVFEDVKVQEQMTDDPNVHDCVVQVEQGNTGNLIFGVGFGDVEGGFLYGNYIEHNLFGLARDLRISALVGSKAISGEVSYLDRYFMGSDIAAQFTAFHRRYDRTGAFRQTNTGVTAEFTRPLSECLKDSVRLRLESIGYDISAARQPDEELRDYVAATIRYKLCHDTRDDTFFPTYGHVAAASFETGAADGFLAKLEGQYAQYWQMCDSWVLANNTVAGLMPYDATRIGYADRFFLGGASDLRGFRVAGAGPHDGRNHSIPLGGSTKLLNQTEARHLFTDNLAGVLFADVGMLGRKPFEIGSPRASIGTGVRLRLPMASVSLDLAVPVISHDDDQTQIFHFNLTSAF